MSPVSLRLDLAVEILRADRGRKIGNEANAKARWAAARRAISGRPSAGKRLVRRRAWRGNPLAIWRPHARDASDERRRRFRRAPGISGPSTRDLGVADAHREERREQMFGRRDARAVAPEHRRARGIDDVLGSRGHARLAEHRTSRPLSGPLRDECRPRLAGPCAARLLRSGAVAQRRLHHRRSIRPSARAPEHQHDRTALAACES